MWKLSLLAVVLLASAVYAKPTAEELTFFENEVRPLLAKHCYECHSADAKRLEASLRVDSLKGMLRGGDSGPIVEPGKPDESTLISAVRYEDFEMPPKGKLADEEVAVLVKWVSMGAPWPDEPEPVAGDEPAEFNWKQRVTEHWCWQPISNPAPPEVENTAWPANTIDRFVLAKLEQANLTPAADADKRTLVRRLYFDLIGLPPTPEQTQAFLANESPDAYERLVDELLDSPHYGEKWTRHWLDLVRYGETLGHEFDYPLHHAYRYRDYVIRALNTDVPYDQFVREHIAGDLIPNPRVNPNEEFNESIIGTGFWFLGEACHSPTDVRQDEADRVDNQIDVFSKTFLGLTLACARCHDHKFDPIPTKDYYAIYGYIQSSRRQEAMLDPRGKVHAAAEELKSINAEKRDAWLASLPDVPAADDRIVAAIEAELASEDKEVSKALDQPTHWLHAAAKLQKAENIGAAAEELRTSLVKQKKAAEQKTEETELFIDFAKDDFSDWYVTGEAFSDSATEFGDQQTGEAPFARVGALHSGMFGPKLRGVLRSPTFVLPAKRVHYKVNAKNANIRLIVDGYTMDEFNALLFNDVLKKNINTQGRTQWVSATRDLYHYVGHRAHIEVIDHGDGFAAIEQIRFSSEGNPVDPPHSLNELVLGKIPTSRDALLSRYVEALREVVARFQTGDATNEEIDVVNWLIARDAIARPAEIAKINERWAAANKQTPTPMHVIALADGDAENEYVFIRGSHKLRGDEAPRRMLVAIAGEDQTPDPRRSGRLDLAEKLTSPTNQLTSRVAVNRLWHHLFGRGIVPTVDDFGKMGQLPSHPELLDWLASDFMSDKGWSTKEAIKQIVMSRTYRMSVDSTVPEQVIATTDPENLLLHKAPVRRLTGEAIRDSLLQLSGRLDPKMFGPSVPVHLTTFMEGRGRPRKSGPLDGDGRRSLYVEVRRNFLWPMMMTFDRPSPFSSMGRRSNSNVPAQSLMLMNDPLIVELAKDWSQRICESESDAEARIKLAFEMAFARTPSPAQLERCLAYVGDSDQPDAWFDLCHMLVNMKSFIFLN